MTRSLLISSLLGTLWTLLFWTRLWLGGGFIGGDTYTYFLPQKAYFADRLKAGEFPFWNPLTGHGYPILGESQTAPLYPLNPLLYGWLDLNTAYAASHLFHYVLAFVGMWLLAERMGLNRWGALLASVVYVYGWFPPRACLEWAIIGGAYLPLTFWCLEGWFQTFRRRHVVGLSLFLALDLLAGHYNLAFITTLGLVAYAVLRVMSGVGSAPPVATTAPDVSPFNDRRWFAALMPPVLCLGLAYGLAAPQLVPSWSLKSQSQRLTANPEFDPGYGHTPPLYLSQVATPWMWFGPQSDPDQAINNLPGSIASLTNKVEAHLYFGLVPLVLAVFALARGRLHGERLDPRLRCCVWIGLFGVIYATGWLLPIAGHLPGFGYFRGPGRWGILASVAVALLSGSVLSRWTLSRAASATTGSSRERFPRPAVLAAVVIVAITTYDLHWVSQHQWYTFLVSDPPINHRSESIVGRLLREAGRGPSGPARMLAPGPNLATLTGHAATPPYLGFGPDAYYLDGGRLPDVRFLQYLSGDATPEGIDIATQFDWLRSAGVTHLLSMKPLPGEFPVSRLWVGFDPLLNTAWARPQEPLFLYALREAPGRIFLRAPKSSGVMPASPVSGTVELQFYSANRVAAEVRSDEPVEVVLTDLPWVEWEVTLDGQQVPADAIATAAASTRVERSLLIPAGVHLVEWRYRPRSLWIGVAAALIALAILVVIARRQPLSPESGG